LSHSTSPFFVMGFFKMGSQELFVGAGLKPPDLCLLSSWDYRREPPAPGLCVLLCQLLTSELLAPVFTPHFP
jgi:hypothetical protein